MIALHSLQEPCGSGYSIDRNHNQGLPIILSSIKIEWTGNFGAPNRVSQYRSLLLPRTATSTLVDPYRGMLEIETILFWDSIIGRYKNAPVFARTRQSREFVPPLPPAYSSPLRGPSAGNGLHLFRRCVRSMSSPVPKPTRPCRASGPASCVRIIALLVRLCDCFHHGHIVHFRRFDTG